MRFYIHFAQLIVFTALAIMGFRHLAKVKGSIIRLRGFARHERTDTVKILICGLLLFVVSFLGQTDSAHSPSADPCQGLSFLEGTWTANTRGGSAGAKGSGSYTFRLKLKHHILARHTATLPTAKAQPPMTANIATSSISNRKPGANR